ncbi:MULTISPECIES: hypothetical protein [Burkholderia cepacia complex]|uniref:hypothetical protein n=1 Tax=Burkholderia cepacia complex TaxID=87882 RepID=UPI000F578DB6|nr:MULTISPECIES: hypothetical protein [Burkholderia cepacia complex]
MLVGAGLGECHLNVANKALKRLGSGSVRALKPLGLAIDGRVKRAERQLDRFDYSIRAWAKYGPHGANLALRERLRQRLNDNIVEELVRYRYN